MVIRTAYCSNAPFLRNEPPPIYLEEKQKIFNSLSTSIAVAVMHAAVKCHLKSQYCSLKPWWYLGIVTSIERHNMRVKYMVAIQIFNADAMVLQNG